MHHSFPPRRPSDLGDYIMLEPEEVAAAIPESDKTLEIEAFIPCADVDDVYFDKPYYLTPADSVAEKHYAVIREAIRKDNVAALARTVLFRRVRRSEEYASELQSLMSI